jgi:DNA polymerase III alpha subunit (gram-positive type)
MVITDFRDRQLLFVDLEMTGLDPLVHEIVEVGAVVVNGRTLAIEKEYEAKVQLKHIETATAEALEINGYTPDGWSHAKPQKDVLLELNQLAPNAMLAGWNVWMDAMFLKLAYLREDVSWTFDYHIHDVIPMAWEYAQHDGELKELRLSALCERLGIERVDKHRALADIKTTVEAFKKLLEISTK